MNQPVAPFLQLMVVLPSSSSDLVPDGLSHLMKEGSPLEQYYPKNFEVDLAGKKKDWEGIVQLPPISMNDFFDHYKTHVKHVKSACLKRNIRGKSFVYRYREGEPSTFMSFYGTIQQCNVMSEPVSF